MRGMCLLTCMRCDNTAHWPAFANRLLYLDFLGVRLPPVCYTLCRYSRLPQPASCSLPPAPFLPCFPACDSDSLLDTGRRGRISPLPVNSRGGRREVAAILLTLKSSSYLQAEDKCSPKSPWDTLRQLGPHGNLLSPGWAFSFPPFLL